MIQQLLGHSSVRTTALYTHVSAKLIAQTKSPLDLLAQENNAQKQSPGVVKKAQKPRATPAKKGSAKKGSAKKVSRQQQSASPKNGQKQRGAQTAKTRKPKKGAKAR